MTVQLNADLIDGTLAPPLEVEAVLDMDGEHWVQIRPTEDNQREILRALARAITPRNRADLMLVRQLSILHPEYRRAMDRLLADDELMGALTWLVSPSSADDLTGPLGAASTTLEPCAQASCPRPTLPGEDYCRIHGGLTLTPIPFVPAEIPPRVVHRGQIVGVLGSSRDQGRHPHRGDGASL